MSDVEEIWSEGELIALIVSRTFRQDGITFFTGAELSQQLAFMRHPAGKEILPHVHNPVPREVAYTQEVLVLRKGKMRVDFYSNSQTYLYSRILESGDVILLATGGHGFEVLEEVEMFEIKQGPYAGELDKSRFEAAPSALIKLK